MSEHQEPQFYSQKSFAAHQISLDYPFKAGNNDGDSDDNASETTLCCLVCCR